MSAENLVAPFPYFGGKRKIVDLVWPYFGEVANYVEPFCGSMAMLLGAPEGKRVETVNDLNGFTVNFWRSIKSDPESTAHWADWPVTEIDLEARHAWLVNRTERLRWSLEDPDFYDPKIAGWWAWGACAWIGSGWCLGEGKWVSNGCNFKEGKNGVTRQLVHLGNKGQGLNKQTNKPRSDFIIDWLNMLALRLRDTRIACGDWSRVVTPSVTTRHGLTAVFLDPPYSSDGIDTSLYVQSSAKEVAKWCLENGNDPKLRIVLCGYEGEYVLPRWQVIEGYARGGYSNGSNQNRKRERLWISPHCIGEKLAQPEMTL